MGTSIAACWGRIAPVPDEGGLTSYLSDASDEGGASDAAASRNDGRGPAPVPSCVGELAQCVPLDAGFGFVGAAVIRCDPVYFVGPWNLLLERQINTDQFKVLQRQSVDEPGFGATFEDTTSHAPQLSYRVCVVDDLGTRCGDPFTAFGPPNCACVPITCAELRACNSTGNDGCGRVLLCGACADGTTCNAHRSCCPPDQESDGIGSCECAPPRPCPRGTEWDVVHCECLGTRG